MPVERLLRLDALAVYGSWFLAAVLCGVTAWGVERWRRHHDWRVLGALARILMGGAIGYGIWWKFVRPIEPDETGLRQLLVEIGLSVGVLWAVIWVIYMQPRIPRENHPPQQPTDDER